MVSVHHGSTTNNRATALDPMDTLAIAVRTELDRRADGQIARIRDDGMLEVCAVTSDATVSGSIHFDLEHFAEDRFLLKVSEKGRMFARSFHLWRLTPSNETRPNLAGVQITGGGLDSSGRGRSWHVDRAAATIGAGRRQRQETEIWMTLAEYYGQCVAAGDTIAAR